LVLAKLLQEVAEENRAQQVVFPQAAVLAVYLVTAVQEMSLLQQAARQQLIPALVAVVEVLTWQM
jgi:hypothetical protein